MGLYFIHSVQSEHEGRTVLNNVLNNNNDKVDVNNSAVNK